MPFAINGKIFDGPLYLGRDKLPALPGMALICTEAGEGVKIMSVLWGDNLEEIITESPKNDCWKRHASHGRVDVYAYTEECTAEEREEFCNKILERGREWMFCEDSVRIEDDF
ncbi:MAG: hypothetical protein GX137_06530 [Thermoplasmatales archaeon]|jgi:hypothetical protein|nr:hypothetical protein [Thermoplasmatales archaeon]